jgi:uncharacterized repeat protein (TIGR01451 family)
MQVEHKIISIGFITVAMAILLLSLMRPFGVRAQYYQPGAASKSIVVDKKVRAVNQTDYMDNLSGNQKLFFDNDLIEFSITVQNSGQETLQNIDVKDFLPKNLGLIFNPGTFDSNGNVVVWKIDKLNPGESKNYLIRAKISGVANLKLSSNLQLTNTASANVDNISDQDSTSYFIGVQTIPKTGNNNMLIKTILILSVASGSVYLRKVARGF